MDIDGSTCIYCQSTDIQKKGTNRTGHKTFFCKTCGKHFSENTDLELVKENVRYKKDIQGLRDTGRIKDKSFREQARVENALGEYSKAILDLLQKYDFSKITTSRPVPNERCAGIIHLSDLHFNELVALAHNKYDFNVASARLRKFANAARSYFKPLGIKNVLIANTGDTLNSDRRLDEYLSQATNRSNATMLAVYLLEQFIVDLNKDFNLKVGFVTGNESRVKDEPGWTPIVATDNYDYTIFNILRHSMRTAKGVEFILGDPTELVVNVAGQNVLLIHGNQIRGSVEQTVQKIKGKYVDRNVLIPFVIFGDVHSARLGDGFARGSSMTGANDYSDKGLQLSGRASQNLHVFYANGNRDGIKVDLQHVNLAEGYEILEELASYHAKSHDKLVHETTIIKVVI